MNEDPSQSSLEDAVEMFISKREMENSLRTTRSYENSLQHLVEWCESEGIETVGNLTGWHLEQWERDRKSEGWQP